jgi:hypothetical protein
MNNYNISGGISGAISDPLSAEAQEHAIKYYEEIRHRVDDIYKIAKYTGYIPEQILKVKNYLFVETHILSTGIKRFDPSFEIAESWQRLTDMQDYIQLHDKLLIPHELMEMELITKGMSQSEAHDRTCLEYDYPSASNEFYERLRHEKNARLGKGDIISGGISHTQRDDWNLCL